MTDELLGDMINSEISGYLSRNTDFLVKQFKSCDPNITPEMSALLTKAIFISSQISTQYVIRFLENCGLLHLPEDGQPLLTLLPNELLQPDEPD